jgi:radical SAM superfamily enzyme YgiQ (UPF0313 family)
MLRFSVLPLTVVAALTPPEHEVRIIDENVQAIDLDADCDLVGITFMTALAPRAYELARAFRSRGKIVVAGGYHPTLNTEEALPHFDAVVKGDAETSWPRLLHDLALGKLGCLYAADHPLDNSQTLCSPIPRRDLLRSSAHYYATINAIQTSRGCMHGCRYCSVTAFHQRTHRRRPVSEVVAEVLSMKGDFIFVDDNIAADKGYAAGLFQALSPLKRHWVSQCSIETADDPAFLTLMHRAGCRGLFVGIETTNPANLAAMGKSFNNSGLYGERIRRLHRAGIGIIAGIIVGMDQDGPGVFQHTFAFLQKHGIDSVQVNILTPLPGTPLYEDIKNAGRLADADWSHYDFRHVVFKPAGMSATELQAGADWLYAQFYRLDRILCRFVRTFFSAGWMPALLGLRLGLTYRYDNRRENIRGWNPARPPLLKKPVGVLSPAH